MNALTVFVPGADVQRFSVCLLLSETSCRLLPGIGRARSSSCLPLFHLRSKFLMRHRNGIPAFTRIPAPRHQFILRQVLDELIEVTVLVLLRVFNRTAKLPVAKALPNH